MSASHVSNVASHKVHASNVASHKVHIVSQYCRYLLEFMDAPEENEEAAAYWARAMREQPHNNVLARTKAATARLEAAIEKHFPEARS
jgi:hypothetical protein